MAATNLPKDSMCRACFDGIYPVALPEDDLIGKHLLEDRPHPVIAEGTL